MLYWIKIKIELTLIRNFDGLFIFGSLDVAIERSEEIFNGYSYGSS